MKSAEDANNLIVATSRPRPGRSLSMRTSLLLAFGSVLLLTAGGIFINSLYTSNRVLRTLSTSLVDHTEALAEVKLDAFFGRVSTINAGTAIRLKNGLLTWGDWDSFRLFLSPMLRNMPQVSLVGAGDGQGNAYNLVRQSTNWLSQEIRPAEWGNRSRWKEFSVGGEFVREWWDETDFDPRTRPWYTGAMEASQAGGEFEAGSSLGLSPFWTKPYKFYTTSKYGLTVATTVPFTNGLDAVVYFDVHLDNLDAFVAENAPSANGATLVLNNRGEVLAWPGQGEYSRDKVLAGDGGVELAANRLPGLAAAVRYWKNTGKPAELKERIRHEGEWYWLAFRALPQAGATAHVLVLVPQNDLLGEAISERQRMVVVLLLGLLCAIGVAFWLAAVYTRPISTLVHHSEAIQRLELTERVDVTSHIVEVQQLSSAQARMSSALESFSRYVPREVIAELLRQGEAAKIGAHPAELTVLFSDIQRFTSISETLPPNDVAQYLSEYFDAIHGIIERHQGTTDKFIGDAIMAFWGAPKTDETHALHAVQAVMECRQRLDELNRLWKAAGRPEFYTTFGLATGPVVVGNVGASNRLNYTVLGNTVNIASRCVGLGRELGCSILALESVATATVGRIEWRRLGPVQVRGISKPMMVCEPLGLIGTVDPAQMQFKTEYERALNAYLSMDFAGALSILEQLQKAKSEDASVRFLMSRCHNLEHSATAELQTDMLSFNTTAQSTKPADTH